MSWHQIKKKQNLTFPSFLDFQLVDEGLWNFNVLSFIEDFKNEAEF